MATVTSTIKMMDAMTGPLKSITSSMNLLIRSFEQMQHVAETDINVDKTLAAAKNQIASAESEIKRQIELATKEQEKFNRSVEKGTENVDGLWKKLKGVAATYLSFQGAKSLFQLSDEMANISARLDLINDGMQTTEMLQEKIFQAAQRAQAPYRDFANSIAALGAQARDAFSSNDEIIAFMEQINKTFSIAGTDATGAASTMYNLTQALSTGVLRGQDLNAVLSNAQPIAQNIANYLGVPVGHIKDLGAEGKITATIVKNAMFAAAEETNAKFKSMPLTWSTVWTTTMNNLIKASQPLLSFINLLANNWSMIGPIVWALVTAVGAYVAIMGIHNAVTWMAVAANRTLIATFLKNPFLWVALAIGVVVSALVTLWKTNDNFAAGLMRTWNAILNFFDQVPIFFNRVGYGIVHAFLVAKHETLTIIEELVNGVIAGINFLIDRLNKIPGVSLDAINEVNYTAYTAAEAEAARQAGEAKIKSMTDESAKKAAEREQKVIDMLENRAAKRAQTEAQREIDLSIPAIPADIDKVGEVGKIRDTVDISSEDLKTMREMAEAQAIQNFVTLQPQLTFGDTHIRQDGRSVDEIIANITNRLNEEIASSAQGVYNVG